MPAQDSQFRKRSVVIVGAGFSGTLTAVNILRQHRGDVSVILVERRTPFGRGLAYHTWDDNFLLNVPAGNMSAFADAPDDFVSFCGNIDPAFSAASFIPRRIYGDYIEHTLASAEQRHPQALQRVNGEAISIRQKPDSKGFHVSLADGSVLTADHAILAFGHFPPRPLQTSESLASTTVIVDSPWNLDALDHLDPLRPVLLLGSGHTAIDVLFRLTKSSHRRKVILLSRRGLLPREHRFKPRPPAPKDFPAYLNATSPSLRACLRALRDEVRRRENAGGDWRDAINELRPHTPEIWNQLSPQDRRRFSVHAMAYWNIHRHRLAPSAFCRLNQMRDAGQLEIIAGKLLSSHCYGRVADVIIRPRGAEEKKQLTVGGVVNRTGPNYDIASVSIPLVAQLRDSGFLQQDALKIGFAVDDDYQVINRSGQPVTGLHYIGPMLKARYWEAIAVPELRVHSQRLAKNNHGTYWHSSLSEHRSRSAQPLSKRPFALNRSNARA